MNRENIFLSTIDDCAASTAREFGLGLEIAQFCTAWNMDRCFPETDQEVREQIFGVSKKVLHAPFNELFPCAIDPKARELAADRYRQAIALARDYGADKVIIHGGYNPWIYYPVWYVGESIAFWKDFLREDPGLELVLENVLEEEPDMLLDIVNGVNSPHLKLCLDVGHVNAYSKTDVFAWLEKWAPYLSHFHIHNNDSDRDSHQQLFQGTIPMSDLLRRAEQLCPNATYTLELMEGEPSVRWLREQQLI